MAEECGGGRGVNEVLSGNSPGQSSLCRGLPGVELLWRVVGAFCTEGKMRVKAQSGGGA